MWTLYKKNVGESMLDFTKSIFWASELYSLRLSKEEYCNLGTKQNDTRKLKRK